METLKVIFGQVRKQIAWLLIARFIAAVNKLSMVYCRMM
jgi:hypothetical protein